MRKFAITLLLALAATGLQAQNSFVHKQSSTYEWPTDPLVLKKLDQWQDLKFGVLFHWGLYAVPGIVESWALCSEDWITRYGHENYQEFKDWYWNGLSKKFAPGKFAPEKWAALMKQAGMKYMIFTTKHHDGFCMFDSKYSDYTVAKIGMKGQPKADLARYVFDAFRDQGFMIGAYFSKPDWHSQDYWWDYYATPDRNVNYSIKQFPERWERYRQFVHNQIGELMGDYGRMDILWLDGGWVCKQNNQDIDMDGVASESRAKQPGLLVVDRTIHGKYENYQTPEQKIPDHQLAYPWESCISLTHAWGWDPKPNYKSPTQVIGMLMEIVAKGGNMVLGVGPTADGEIQPESVERLEQIGRWMAKNGKAIYNTRITPVYHDGDTWFVADKNGSTLYALYALPEGKTVPATLTWKGNVPAKGTAVRLVATGEKAKWTAKGDEVTVTLPKKTAGSSEPIALQLEVKK